ncbi:MAG: hypothetical protein EOP84_33230 [Verrucomicrobiaceae bacterium]|nr:MAG: hypothetical protein EOP84_33230 [Verrucomicrobiaceae bacterium]
MDILLIYGTAEGQTRKITQFAAQCLKDLGHSTTVIEVNTTAVIDMDRFDAVILAAPVHAGRHYAAVTAVVRAHRNSLEQKPNAFLSVSMSAARSSPKDEERLMDYRSSLIRNTGWTPSEYHDVAGARLYTRHNPFTRWILGMVDRWRYDTSRDHEFTDWGELRTFSQRWSEAVGQRVHIQA